MTNDVQVPKPIFLVVLVGEPQKHYQKLRQTKCVQQMQKRSQLANVARDLQCGAKRGGEVHWTPQLLSMIISVQNYEAPFISVKQNCSQGSKCVFQNNIQSYCTKV